MLAKLKMLWNKVYCVILFFKNFKEFEKVCIDSLLGEKDILRSAKKCCP